MTRRRVSSGGPWESVAGYSRAVVIGDSCWVAGTTDAGPDGASLHPGDVAGQARAVFGIIDTDKPVDELVEAMRGRAPEP